MVVIKAMVPKNIPMLPASKADLNKINFAINPAGGIGSPARLNRQIQKANASKGLFFASPL